MHELSIAMNIIRIASQAATEEQAERVSSIELEIGQLAGVEFQALDMALDVAVRDTMLEKAEIKIDKVEGLGRCTHCGQEFKLGAVFMPCPDCEHFDVEILRGRELNVRSIIIE